MALSLTLDLKSNPKVAAWCEIFDSVPDSLNKALPILEKSFSKLSLPARLNPRVEYDPETGEPSFYVIIVITTNENDPDPDVHQIFDMMQDFNHSWYSRKNRREWSAHFMVDFDNGKKKDIDEEEY